MHGSSNVCLTVISVRVDGTDAGVSVRLQSRSAHTVASMPEMSNADSDSHVQALTQNMDAGTQQALQGMMQYADSIKAKQSIAST